MRSRFYTGHVTHARIEPVEHSFRYPAYVFALDVDELGDLDRSLRLFGHNRHRPFALHDADHLGRRSGSLRDKLAFWTRRAGFEPVTGRIELLTTARFFGHTFNPVSFYFCYDADGSVSTVVVEVNNTFGEGHVYVLDADATLAGHSAPKTFHVSPFNDVDGAYEFRLAPPGDTIDLRIDLRRDGRRSFASRLSGDARPLDAGSLRRLAATYPFTAMLTLPRILWQAFRLHYGKSLPVHAKPAPSSPMTYRAGKPAYISEFRAPTWLQRRTESKLKAPHGSN